MIHNPSRLYHQLIKFAGQYSKWSDWRHLSVMCWMMVGLIAEGSVNLTKWLDHIQSKAKIAQFGFIRLLSVNQVMIRHFGLCIMDEM